MASTYDLMANNGGYIYINGEMSGKPTNIKLTKGDLALTRTNS